MIPQNSPGLQTVARFVYNQSLLIAPNGEIVYRRSLPVQSKAKDSRELKEILASERGRQKEKEDRATANNYKFELNFAWFLLRKICGVGSAIAPKFKKTKVSTGRGLLSPNCKNFTKKSQRDLRYGAGAMERHLGKERCKFVTLTVPGSTPDATRVVAQWSGWLMNRIQTWITDNFTHSNGKKYVIGVVELQKRGMLHWHFLVGLESFFYYEKFAAGIEMLWYKLLCQLSKKSGVNLFQKSNGHDWKPEWESIKHRAVRVENVKKSVSNYLAKYISKNPYKNVSEVQYKGVKTKVYSPSRWWTKSRDIDDLIAEYTIRLPLNVVAPSLIDEIFDFTKDIFNSFGFWTVETLNPYSKQKIGVLARGKYEDAKECCEILAGIINEVSTVSRQAVNSSQKLWHSANNRITKELDLQRQEQAIVEYVDAQGIPFFMRRRSQHKIHKQYHDALKQGHTMQEAFKYAGMD